VSEQAAGHCPHCGDRVWTGQVRMADHPVCACGATVIDTPQQQCDMAAFGLFRCQKPAGHEGGHVATYPKPEGVA
jgi:hypothetical protein